MGRKVSSEVPPDELPEGEVAVEASSQRRIRRWQNVAHLWRCDDQRGRIDDIFSFRATRSEAALAFLNSAKSASASRPFDRRSIYASWRIHAGQSVDFRDFRRRYLRLAPGVWCSLCAASRTCRCAL